MASLGDSFSNHGPFMAFAEWYGEMNVAELENSIMGQRGRITGGWRWGYVARSMSNTVAD